MLLKQLGREPTDEEAAEELGWSVDEVAKLRRLRQFTVSLETPVGDEEATLQEFLEDTSGWSPDELAIREITRENTLALLQELPPRLRLVLELRFGLIDQRPRALEEVGQELGVTRERVRQLERQALDRLRASKGLVTVMNSQGNGSNRQTAKHQQIEGGATMSEVLVGRVTHYYSKLSVAALDINAPLHKGDQIHIRGHTTDLEETIESMEIDHQPVDLAQPGDDVAIKVPAKVREGDKIYLAIAV